eukprot:GHVN01086106.1.p1 GENE.GHVN01086106.1~~GHVN01086106.1.p1  ORF type:complete len:552 (+),score=164.83 GHVN01086106.1:229-1884(+)
MRHSSQRSSRSPSPRRTVSKPSSFLRSTPIPASFTSSRHSRLCRRTRSSYVDVDALNEEFDGPDKNDLRLLITTNLEEIPETGLFIVQKRVSEMSQGTNAAGMAEHCGEGKHPERQVRSELRAQSASDAHMNMEGEEDVMSEVSAVIEVAPPTSVELDEIDHYGAYHLSEEDTHMSDAEFDEYIEAIEQGENDPALMWKWAPAAIPLEKVGVLVGPLTPDLADSEAQGSNEASGVGHSLDDVTESPNAVEESGGGGVTHKEPFDSIIEVESVEDNSEVSGDGEGGGETDEDSDHVFNLLDKFNQHDECLRRIWASDELSRSLRTPAPIFADPSPSECMRDAADASDDMVVRMVTTPGEERESSQAPGLTDKAEPPHSSQSPYSAPSPQTLPSPLNSPPLTSVSTPPFIPHVFTSTSLDLTQLNSVSKTSLQHLDGMMGLTQKIAKGVLELKKRRRPTKETQTMANDVTKVRYSVKEVRESENGTNLLYGRLQPQDDSETSWLPLQNIAREHPMALLQYLIPRIHVPQSSKQNGGEQLRTISKGKGEGGVEE